MPDVTIDKVQIEIEATAKSADKVLKQLESSLKSVKSALSGFDTSSLEKLQKALDGIEKKANSVSKTKVTPKVDTSKVDRAEQKIRNDLDKIQDKFTRMQSLEVAAKGGDSSALTSWKRLATSLQGDIDVLGEKLKRLGETRTPSESWKQWFDGDKIQQYRDGLLGVQNALDSAKTSMAEFGQESESIDGGKITSALKAIGSDATNTAKKLLTLVGGAIKSGLSTLASLFGKLRDAAKSVRNGIKDLSKWTDKGFMRVLKYGFGIRSLYVGFRRLRKAVVESFGELQKSGAFFQTTKANIEGLKTSLATLKFQFGAAFEPIFNTVAPALQSFINYLIQAMNVLSAFIAKVTGKDTYSKVAAVTLAAAKNTAGAAKAAKELNKQLQGFDELNNLTSNNNTGGGGGGGGGASGDSAVYEEASVESALGDFGKALADAIAKGDWELVGSTISDKLTDELRKLNSKWPEIFAAANSFGTNLASFFNGLISDDLFSELGTAVGNAINTALTASLAFAQKFDWKGLGTAIASGIDAFVQTNPLKLVVENFNTWALGILDTLITAVDTMIENGTLNTISKHIEEAISGLEIGEIAWKVGKLGSSLANSLYIIVSNKKTWVELGQKIADGINGFFTGMSEVNEETGLSGWAALGKDIEATLVGIGTSIITALDGVDWEAVGKSIADFIGSIDFSNILITFKNIMVAIGKAIKGALDGAEISVEDVVLTLVGIGLVLAGISAAKLAASITASYLSSLLVPKIEALLASGLSIAAKIGKVTLAIAAALVVGYAIGKTLGDLIVHGLENLGIISSDAAGEYYANNSLSISQKISDIKLAYDTKDANNISDLKKGWNLMWDEIYGPVFDEVKQVKIKIHVGFEKLKESVNDAKKDFDDAWNATFNGQSEVAVGRNGMPSDVSEIVDAQEQSAMNDHGYNLWMGIYKGFEMAMTVTNPIIGPIILLRDKIAEGFKTIFGEGSPCTKMYPHGQYIYEGIIEGFKKAMNVTSGDFSVNGAIAKLKELFNSTIKTLFTGWDAGKIITEIAKITLPETSSFSVVDAVLGLQGLLGNQLITQFTGWDAGSFISQVANLTLGLNATITTTASSIGQEIETLKQDIQNTLGTVNIKTKLKKIAKTELNKVKNQVKSFREKINNNNVLRFTIDVTSNVKSLSNWIDTNIIDKVNKSMKKVVPKFEEIPHINARRYAAATGAYADKATNVIFGEAGAEAIIPLERNLGAINKIADAMLDGMARVGGRTYTASPKALAYSGGTVSSPYTSTMSQGESQLLTEQNKLIAEQNRLLQIIAQKDVTISTKEIFNATRKEAQNYNNRTGNSPFLF